MTSKELHPEPNQETVQQIVGLATSKCFDWAQGAIPETMAAVAAQLAKSAVVTQREITKQDVEDGRL